MDALFRADLADWTAAPSDALQHEAIAALESGRVLLFPQLPFVLRENETALLSPSLSNGRAKNISLDPSGKLKHTDVSADQHETLRAMMERFAQSSVALVGNLFPGYAAKLERARTSYRPVEIAGRSYSPVKDDTRLHVDAFPTRPMRGRRILRLFTNINPNGAPRLWHTGEPFEDMAKKILPKVREPIALTPLLLAAVGATRGRRSAYDNLMLGLHDNAKLDESYQRATVHNEIAFPAGSTWLCFTDQVMHAALAGQYVLEQTFHLDIDAMAEPTRAPIKVLERMTGRTLA
ncbi:MAG TPA: Kdo hydroxylase family protein [Rhizomicrobium sp.]|jgi:hypothetical protein